MQAWDRYAFVNNNPLRFTDPSGHCIDGVTTLACITAIAMGVGAIAGGAYSAYTQYQETGQIDIEQVAAAALGGALAGGGLVIGAAVVGGAATAGATALAGAGATACADGDCTNEAQAVGQAVQNGSNLIKNGTDIGYNSFNTFKYAQGPAGSGMAWHHIVEQNPINIDNFGTQAINNTSNLIRLPSGAGLLHQRISGYYSSIQPLVTGSDTLTVRQWLQAKSFEYQWNFGVELIKKFGGAKYIVDQFGDKAK